MPETDTLMEYKINVAILFMSKKNKSAQLIARREMMKNYFKDTDLSIFNGSAVKNIMRDMRPVFLEGAMYFVL